MHGKYQQNDRIYNYSVLMLDDRLYCELIQSNFTYSFFNIESFSIAEDITILSLYTYELS